MNTETTRTSIENSNHSIAAGSIVKMLRDFGQNPTVCSYSTGSDIVNVNLLRAETLLKAIATAMTMDCSLYVSSGVKGHMDIAIRPIKPEPVTIGELEKEGRI